MSVAIEVQAISKSYRLGEYHAAYGTLRETLVHAARRLAGQEHNRARSEIWALQDVSFEVPEGQVLGVIGRNGAGKSTLLKILTRIATPTSGRAEIRGRVGSLLEVGTGFNGELTGRENIYLNAAILGMTESEVARKFDDIVDFADIARFLDTPVGRYSSGMFARLGFSVAVSADSDIFIIDEVLAVGDPPFKKKCIRRIKQVRDEGRTIVFVSHNTTQVKRLCDRALVLVEGRLGFDGSVQDAVHFLEYDADDDDEDGEGGEL